MAARLIQRFSRLLVASAHFPVSSCSTPLECIRACHPVRAVPLHTSAICRYTDTLRLQLKKHVNSQSETDFLKMIKSMTVLEELLQVSTKYSNYRRVAFIISRIAKVTETNHADVVMDKRFQEMLSTVDKQIQTIWHVQLISLLEDLYALRLDEKSRFLRSVETEVQWRLKRLSIVSLGRLARVCVPHAKTDEQKMLVQDLAKYVELRWTEVADTKTLTNVVYNLGQVSKKLLERMEDKVLEFAEHLTPEESRTITMSLAAQNCRSLPILRALSFHLLQKNQELQPRVIVDLAYSYAVLNFGQHQVLQKFVSNLLPKVPELSIKMMTSVLHSFAKLRFFNLLLCEAIAQVCLDRSNLLTPTQLSVMIRCFAQLNFLPSQQEEFFSKVVQPLSTQLDYLTPSNLVDLVWALCVLQLVTPAFLEKALDPKIYNEFLGKTSKKCFYSMKLTQINATAKLECPEYGGPFLPSSLLSVVSPEVAGSRQSSMHITLSNALLFLFDNKCDFNVKTVYGHQIDAEFVLDSEHNPLALQNFEDPHVLHSNGRSTLPEGARRFAVKCWEFSDFCLRTKDLVGWNALCRRHLRAANFLVIEVPFYEWQELKSESQKSEFLKNQIKKVVAEQTSV